MTRPTRRELLALAVPAFTLAACSRATESAEEAPSTSSETTPDENEATDTSDLAGPVPDDADEDSTAAASDAAIATMSIWVQGSQLQEQEWRRQLDPTLTPAGRKAADRTWGYNVPDREVVGDPKVIRANAESAVLHVTTDYTTYEVTVVKTGDGAWKTSNLTTELMEGSEG